MDINVITLILPAFIAGVITFLAPCSLPLVPAYLAFIGGANLHFENTAFNRHRIFINSVFYVCGFSLVFILLGAFVGAIGGFFSIIRPFLLTIAGIFIIGMGIFGLLESKMEITLPNFLKINLPKSILPGTQLGAFLLGSSFAVGWTPCVGAILGSILLIASTSHTAVYGAFLLLVFSIGLAIPFLLVSFSIAHAQKFIQKNLYFFSLARHFGNILLVGLGILILTDNFTLLIQFGFKLFPYESILRYL